MCNDEVREKLNGRENFFKTKIKLIRIRKSPENNNLLFNKSNLFHFELSQLNIASIQILLLKMSFATKITEEEKNSRKFISF